MNAFWRWTTRVRPSWKEDPKEAAIVCTVFGVTGSSTLFFVRPCLNKVGINGTMRDGPWSYRVASVFAISPIYSCLLITFGTLAGRHLFFANMGRKILARFAPPSFKEKIVCPPAAARSKKTRTMK